MSEELDDNIVKEEGLEFDTSFEDITPWNGAYDTGKDVRMKWLRNFKKIRKNFEDLFEKVISGIDDRYLHKDRPDQTEFLVKFLKGLEAGLYAEGGKDGSKLHADGLAELGRMQVNGDSEFRGNLSSKEFISGFLTGKGWAIQLKKVLNAAGVEEDKYVAEFDDLIIRGTLRVYEFIVSQLLGENDNRIFTAMLEVDHYDKSSGKVYLDTQDGKFYNPFRVDDYIMVQQYNGMPSEKNNFYVTKQYELIVTEVGMENELAWVKFKDFTTTMEGGNAESLIAKKDTFVRIDNLSDPDRKGIIQMMTVGSNTPYMDVAYGLKTDPDNALKVRIGKLEGIYNSLFGWLKDYGAYLLNVYAIGSYRQRVTGEDLYTKIEMLKEQFLTEFKSQYYTLTDEDNFLKNTAFTADMQYWTVTNNVQFFKIGGVPLYLNRNLITSKIGVAQVEEYNGKKMLHLNNNTVKQLNKDIRKPGTHKEYVTDDDTGSGAYKEVKDTLYLYLRFYARTSGRLTIGFPASSQEEGALPYTEIDIDEDAEMQVMQWQGTWDSAGDFVLGYTGDMYVSLLSLTTEPLDNFKVETSTRFEQTSRYILLVGEKVDEANKSITELGLRIDAAEEQILLYADKIDEANQEITKLGLRIDAAEENITLYAEKISDTEDKLAKLELSVDGITSTVADGDTIVSTINQTATTVAIKAERINLNGYVSANNSFSVDTDGTINLGGFTVDEGRFIWEQHDYFGGISRGLKLGYSNYDDEGVIDVRFNPSTFGVFGIKIAGGAPGGACIYANSKTTGQDYTSLLPSGMSYAGYFKGPVVARDTDYGFSSDVIAGSEIRAITGWNDNGTYTYLRGISFDSTYDLDDVRFTVRNGLIVALHKDNGEIIIQG